MYRPSVSDDLQQFFDFYCKPDIAKDTNWDSSTPRVRLSLLGFEADGSFATTVIERPEQSYPLARQRLRTLYLDGATGKLGILRSDQECIKSYEGRSLRDGLVSFVISKRNTQRLTKPRPSQLSLTS